MKKLSTTILLIVFLNGFSTMAFSAQKSSSSPFHFENVKSFHEMFDFIRNNFPLGSTRNNLREVFVKEGKATLKEHPKENGIEKYLYDINLCNYYIWRWNISADYDQTGLLQQAYINGNPVFAEGKQKKSLTKEDRENKNAKIFKATRLRPEAHKGESSLAYLLFDSDGNQNTLGDQELIGSGPSRPNPLNMGKMVTYKGIDPWRSIFDSDEANHIIPYQGDCAAVDQAIKKMKNKANQR